MAEYSDQELLFLSNLMHMKKETVEDKNGNDLIPFADVWTESEKGNTIGNIISKIDTTKLREEPLKNYKFDGEISGYEWGNMIDAMKNSDICELKLQDVSRDEKNSLSTYFTDKEGKAYVVFRGTSAGEWPDNFHGGAISDTEQQKRALTYINSIDADHITVVGHSKGGNKAKYVALLSDKVDRCVAFDGQGFSQLFIDKYQDLIEANKHKITCYALDEDFVNILLYDIYNTKHYIAGNGVDNFAENHSPNSFFHFTYELEPGMKPSLYDFNYKFNQKSKMKISGVEFKETKQAEYIANLHSFVNYISSTIPDKDREAFFSFLGKTAEMALGKKPPNYTDKYTSEEFIEHLAAEENSDQLGLLVAYIIEYEEDNDGITDAILEILNKSGNSKFTNSLIEIGVGVVDIIGEEKLLKNIIKEEWKISLLLKVSGKSTLRKLFKSIVKGYERKKNDVKKVTEKNTAAYNMYDNDYIRDYSQDRRNLLLKLTDAVASEKPYDVAKWDIWYRFEDWFGMLDIDNYKNNIDKYYQKVIDINDTSHQQMIQIFNEVDRVIMNYKRTMMMEIDKLNVLSNKIVSL
jgi:hypothetical protein